MEIKYIKSAARVLDRDYANKRGLELKYVIVSQSNDNCLQI